MIRLCDKLNLTVTMSVIKVHGTCVINIVCIKSPVEIVMWPGSILNFHALAQGNLALAFNLKLWEVVTSGPLKVWTLKTIMNVNELKRLVDLAHACHWADAPKEYLYSVTALLALIFNMTNKMVATVTVAGPVNNIGVPPRPKIIEAVTIMAKAISSNLGSTEYSR
jgi:DNA-binding IclR family transcriptional regulator